MAQIIECDSVVIGSGAGGAVAAYSLALAGRSPIVLEEGPRVEATDIAHLSSSQALSLLYRHAGVQPVFGSPKVVYGEGRCVGGSTIVNGGLLWFPPEWRVDRWRALRGSLVPSYAELSKHSMAIAGILSISQQNDGLGNKDSIALRRGATNLDLRWQHPQRALIDCVHSNRCTMGCPTGAKQTVLDTYLKQAERHGAVVVPNAKAIRLKSAADRVSEVRVRIGTETKIYRPKSVFLAAGAIGSPELLLRSGLWRSQKKPSMGWHANIRFIAKFKDPVDAESGTIFTTQINEYERRGIYLMPANATRGTLAGFLQGHGPQVVMDYLESPHRYAVFTAQVEMRGQIRISQAPALGRVLSHRLTSVDEGSLRFASEKMLEVLFSAGADVVFPPVNGHGSIPSVESGEAFSRQSALETWQILSVHGMASCPMGDPDRGGIVDAHGRLPTLHNLHLTDASILPGTSGISPQGSIMGLAQTVMNNVSG